MSTQAVAWALDARQTGPITPDVRLVLVALADYANPEGRGAWPSTSTLAERLGISTRAIKRSLSQLRDRGFIAPGDQELVSHIRGDRRPTVYDVALHGIQVVIVATGESLDLAGEPYREEAHGETAPSPRAVAPRRDSTVTPRPVDNPPRGDTHDLHGVTPVSPNPRTKHSNPTHPSSEGDPKARAIATGPLATASLGPTSPPPARRERHQVSNRGTLTGSDCPACGQHVGTTHTCRASALDPNSPMHHVATVDAIHRLEDARHVDDELPFAEHDPCLVCGTTSPQRPIIDDALGTCARCTAAHYRDQERAKRTATTPGEPA